MAALDEPESPVTKRLDARIADWMAERGPRLLRVALGIVFLWFGFLKFFPGLSTAETLAARTIMTLTAGYVTPTLSLPALAAWECLIGLGLLTGKLMRATLLLLFAQMVGTFMPLLFFPAETWKYPFVPTLEGQYIIKNVVLVSAGILLGATVRGGKIIADPKAVKVAERVQGKC
jgi:uncharacterized membrane protein YphA (DoxX/SURF4 family)